MTKNIFVFLPFWVEAAFKRNGCSLDACLDFGQARQILSLEDMSGLLALQDIKAVTRDESVLSRTLLTSWYESAKGAQRIELDSSIIPLARSNELKEEILNRLLESSNVSETSLSETAPARIFYKVVDLDRNASGMVVYSGFPEFISKPENEYKVVVDQLKIFYVYLKAYQVSLLPLFGRYLYLLKARITPLLAV